MEEREIRVAVCDDLPAERLALARMVWSYFKRLGRLARVDTYASGGEFLFALRPERYHIVFLDIYMDGLSGLETAHRLRQKDGECFLIFATTSRDYGVDSYEYRAADYLLKPIGQSEVDGALDWCMEGLTERLREIVLCSGREHVRVMLKDIRYIEIQSHMAMTYTVEGCIPTRRGLDDLEREIASPDFLRCHRSYLVNMRHVLHLNPQEIQMVGGGSVPVAQANTAKTRQQFIEWSFDRAWESR